jgi:hypothetical protein
VSGVNFGLSPRGPHLHNEFTNLEAVSSLEAVSCLITQGTKHTLCIPEVQCSFHKRLTLVPVPSQLDPLHILPTSQIHFLLTSSRTGSR